MQAPATYRSTKRPRRPERPTQPLNNKTELPAPNNPSALRVTASPALSHLICLLLKLKTGWVGRLGRRGRFVDACW